MDKFSKAPSILPVVPPAPRPTKMKPPHPHLPNIEGEGEIGRASCRERV